MTVTSLCVLSCKFFGSSAVHSSKPTLPHPTNPHHPAKIEKKSVSCEFRISFSPWRVFHANRRLDVWNNSDGTQHNVLHSLSKRKIVALNVQSGGSEFKRTGKAVGVILKAFKILSSLFPRPVLLFFFFFFLAFSHSAVRLLEQSITVSKFLFSALAWKHSGTACFHFRRGKAGLCFKTPASPDVP